MRIYLYVDSEVHDQKFLGEGGALYGSSQPLKNLYCIDFSWFHRFWIRKNTKYI